MIAAIALAFLISVVLAFIGRGMANDPMRLPRGGYWPPAESEDFTNLVKAFNPFRKV